MAEDTEKKDPLDVATDKVKKSVGLVESMGCCCLNLGCMLLVLGVLSLISLIVSGITNPLDLISNIFGSIWHSIAG
jgi:hypothetical protein